MTRCAGLLLVTVAAVAAVLAGCRRSPRSAPASPGADDGGARAGAVARTDPAAERLHIAAVLEVLAQADAGGDWSQASALVAEPLLLTACGNTAALKAAEVAAGEFGRLSSRGGMAAPEITLIGDGAAWALSLRPQGAILEVLERRAAGWVVVASAASASPAAWATACAPWQGRVQLVLLPGQDDADVHALRKLGAAEWKAYLAKDKGGAAAGYVGPVPGALCGERHDDLDGPPRARHIDLDRPISAAPIERAFWVGSGAAAMVENWEASFPTDGQPTQLAGTRLVVFERRGGGFVRVASADGLAADGEHEVCDHGSVRTIVTSTSITILDDVKFAPGSAEVPAAAAALLDAVAATLEGNPDITKVEVQGHADRAEADVLGLSQARAEAVRALLLTRGIAPGRLVPKGMGDDVPAGPGRSTAARAKNRRVMWVILERL